MKKLSMIVFLLALSFTRVAMAGDDKNGLKALSNKVQRFIKTPEALKGQGSTQKITIYFSVNANGDVIDVIAGTENTAVKKDLENQFSCMNFKGLKPDVTNSIDVVFVVY